MRGYSSTPGRHSARRVRAPLPRGAGRAAHPRAPVLVMADLASAPAFLERVHARLVALGLDAELAAPAARVDHVCWRVPTRAAYARAVSAALAEGHELAVESEIGGRPIAVLKLREPIVWGGLSVPALELPAPKPGRPKPEGWEHIEVALGVGALSGAAGVRALEEMVARHPGLEWDTKSLSKAINPEVSVALGNGACVKFHCVPLLEVAAHELAAGLVVPVMPPPGTYARIVRMPMFRHEDDDGCNSTEAFEETIALAPGGLAVHCSPPQGSCRLAPTELLVACARLPGGGMELQFEPLAPPSPASARGAGVPLPPTLRWGGDDSATLESADDGAAFVRR